MKKFSLSLLSALLLVTTPAFAKDTKHSMTVTSTGFKNNMAMPVLYTCDGQNVSPEFAWSNLPAKTETLAIIMKDPDAPSGVFYHWGLYNIPKTINELPQGTTTLSGASAAVNNFDKNTYSGPCPPKGSAHTYVFTLYALDSKLNLPNDTDVATLEKSLKEHSVGQVTISGVYARWMQ